MRTKQNFGAAITCTSPSKILKRFVWGKTRTFSTSKRSSPTIWTSGHSPSCTASVANMVRCAPQLLRAVISDTKVGRNNNSLDITMMTETEWRYWTAGLKMLVQRQKSPDLL